MVVLVTTAGSHTAKFGSTDLVGLVSDGASWFSVPAAVWRRELRAAGDKPYRRALVTVDGKPVGEIWRAEGE